MKYGGMYGLGYISEASYPPPPPHTMIMTPCGHANICILVLTDCQSTFLLKPFIALHRYVKYRYIELRVTCNELAPILSLFCQCSVKCRDWESEWCSKIESWITQETNCRTTSELKYRCLQNTNAPFPQHIKNKLPQHIKNNLDLWHWHLTYWSEYQ